MTIDDHEETKLDEAVGRLSRALERIVDGLDRLPPTTDARRDATGGDHQADASETAALNQRVSALEVENRALRNAGQAAIVDIDATIAALEVARS